MDLENEDGDDISLLDDASETGADLEPDEEKIETATLADPEPARTERGEDDDAAYSRRVKKRIDREVYKTKAERERADRLEAELAALRADVETVKSRNAAADAQAVEGALRDRLASARQRLKQAIQDGDEDAHIAATEEIADLKAESREMARAKERQPESRPQPAPKIPSGTARWLEQNQWYMSGNPDHYHAARLAAELDAALRGEGYTPDDPGMYQELNRRLKAAMPKAASLIGDVGDKPERKRDAGPPVGASSPDGTAKPASGGRRPFTPADRDGMRKWNLKDTPENRKIWLVNNPTPPQD